MRIKADFEVSPAAHAVLLELGYKHVSRMGGSAGWGVSIDIPAGVLMCVRRGDVSQASRWDVRAADALIDEGRPSCN